MKGDFTRDTFDRSKHYTAVLMQQGRVQLDADWNEQARLLLYRLEVMARDLIGWGGGPDPKNGGGFDLEVKAEDRDFFITPGRYYVEGLLVENETGVFFSSHTPEQGKPSLDAAKTYLIYLDAWEDFVSAAQDPLLRETGLNGADTAGRAKVFWRVRAQEVPAVVVPTHTCDNVRQEFAALVATWQGDARGLLKARVNPGEKPSDDPCVIPPSNRYRGTENQLYRVEIHQPGPLTAGKIPGATFKWSRENGSVVFPISPDGVSGEAITIDNAGRDANLGLQPGDWVEVVAPSAPLLPPQPLFRVSKVDRSGGKIRVEVKGKPRTDVGANAVLRRWDQKSQPDNRGGAVLASGDVPVREGDGDVNWISLENGIEIQFQKKDKNNYRAGDYWLIPARVAAGGQLEWPSTDGQADALPPAGIRHRYAPLAVLQFNNAAGPVVCQLRKTMGSVVDIPPGE